MNSPWVIPRYLNIEAQFQTVEVSFDKFHVMKQVNEAVDDMRKSEQRDAPQLKKT
uniref:transposase n=1 Tax=Paenibacillus sp. FSL H8-0537 TaxID=2921399 RepID=UPI00405385F7